MGLDLSVQIESLDKFYREADIVEDTGRQQHWESHDECYDPNFVGLGKEEILASKYSYKKGLDNLKQIEKDLLLGGVKKKYKYDEFDGDDMNYDRFLEQLPSLKKRIKTLGSGHGKFINLHVCICENAWCSSNSLMNRAYTVMRIIDYLEDLGYRVGVYVYTDTSRPGSYKGETIDSLHVEVQIKKPEEPLLRPLILTAVSAWMFRFWMFKFRSAKFYTDGGMGTSMSKPYEDTKCDLYIRRGECLDEDDSERRIERIAEKYEAML